MTIEEREDKPPDKEKGCLTGLGAMAATCRNSLPDGRGSVSDSIYFQTLTEPVETTPWRIWRIKHASLPEAD